MGCGMSTEDKEGKARNEEIENQLKRDKMMQRNEIKMLLLGMCCYLAALDAEIFSSLLAAGSAVRLTLLTDRCW
jgi:hypothetical protein